MKQFTIRPDSWHYKWLSWYSVHRDVWHPKSYRSDHIEDIKDFDPVKYYANHYTQTYNFCAYWRKVLLWPALRFAFNIVPYIVVIAALLYFGIHGTLAMGALFFVGVFAGAALLLGLAFGGIWAFDKFKMKATEVVTAVERTEFVGTMIQSYKNKMCPIVSYEGDDN